MSKSLKLEEVSIYKIIIKSITPAAGVFYFYRPKIWCRVLASIFEYSNTSMAEYPNPLFPTNPSANQCFIRGALQSKTGPDRSRQLRLWLIERREPSWFWRPVVDLQRGLGLATSVNSWLVLLESVTPENLCWMEMPGWSQILLTNIIEATSSGSGPSGASENSSINENLLL